MRVWLLLVIISLMTGLSGVAAQTSPALYLLTEGSLYTYEEGKPALEPVTFCASDRFGLPPLGQSADGTRLVWRAVEPEAAAALAVDWYFTDNAVPGALVVCDLATQTLTQIAPLTAPARRSPPSWSPDGESVAWAEDDGTGTAIRLMRYDLASGQMWMLVELPAGTRFDALQAQWGGGGIALLNMQQSDDPATPQTVEIYNEGDGILKVSYTIPMEYEVVVGQVAAFLWIESTGKLLIRQQYADWVIFDSTRGYTEVAVYPPEVYAWAYPEGDSLVLYPGNNLLDGYNWRLRRADDPTGQNLIDLGDFSASMTDVPAMSSDGAYVIGSESTVIYRPDQQTYSEVPLPAMITQPVSFVWSPVVWRIWDGQSWAELFGWTGSADG